MGWVRLAVELGQRVGLAGGSGLESGLDLNRVRVWLGIGFQLQTKVRG